MTKLPILMRRVTPLALALMGGAVLALLMAFALVWTSLNEYRSGTGFRRVLRAYGAGAPEMAAEDLPAVIAAKPGRYPYPRLLMALLKLRSLDPKGASQLYRDVLDEQPSMLTPREKALCFNGLGVTAVMEAEGAGRSEAFRNARELFQKAVEAWPALPESHLNLAALDFLESDAEKAARHLKEVLAEGSLPPGMEGVRTLAVLRMLMAEKEGKAGSAEEAVAQARCHLSYRSQEPQSRAVLARALGFQAGRLPPGGLSLEDTECERLLEPLSRTVPAPMPRDLSAAACGAARFRMESLWAAHLQNTDLPDRHVSFTRRRILSNLNLASALSPDAPWVRSFRCAQFAREILWSPDGEDPLLLAKRYQGEFQALADLKELEPSVRSAAENALAFALALQPGHDADALPHAEKAVALAPDDPVAALNRAILLDRLGRRDEAKVWYAKSLALKGAQPGVQARLASLSGKGPTS